MEYVKFDPNWEAFLYNVTAWVNMRLNKINTQPMSEAQIAAIMRATGRYEPVNVRMWRIKLR